VAENLDDKLFEADSTGELGIMLDDDDDDDENGGSHSHRRSYPVIQ
jgi:hypothetical protein